MMYEKRLIEGKFPCGQVGAETQRERGASSALPPLYFLHVWWARRPLTPSRAAVLGSILPADVNPDDFLRNLGIVKKQVVINSRRWTLVGKNLELIRNDGYGEYIPYSEKFDTALAKENERRKAVREALGKLCQADPVYRTSPLIERWLDENKHLSEDELFGKTSFKVETVVADPVEVNNRIDVAASSSVKEILRHEIKIDPEDLYGYGRAYQSPINAKYNDFTVLDCTAGGGSIPFEALRLGCNVIANDLNSVASAIEKATLEYPAVYGKKLIEHISKYGSLLESTVNKKLENYYHFEDGEIDIQGLLYHRTVTCPHCGERAPLLNAYALQKKADGWMVIPRIDGVKGHRKVHFEPVRLVKGKGPHGENPEEGSVKRGVGTCLHCGQIIDSEEIKRQAQGVSEYGVWSDDLYCIVAKRLVPKLDKQGEPMIIKTGPLKGQVKMAEELYFREPVDADFAALERAEQALKDNWERWEDMNLIPTERVPEGNDARPQMYGSYRWCDMFTPRQLLAHLTGMETLQELIPKLEQELGEEKGHAVAHYLQYMLDKGIDYNSRQTRWHYSRGVAIGTFGRHDFSLKWSFTEMIYSGINSGLVWGKNQVLDAYTGLCELLCDDRNTNIKIINGSASSLDLKSNSVDVICLDPPYYNNVQYAELSDYFYVWQKRTFRDIYPDWFSRRLTNKDDEAVANPVRDGSAKEANRVYEERMSEIFAECRRVIKDDGIMTMMFTHKTQEAWETLTKALIVNGWIITAAFPVDSESSASLHQKDMAAAASSIFIACRKRSLEDKPAAIWKGFGNSGVLPKLRKAVRDSLKEFEPLHLNPVDEMVASYGSALKVLSENWPVMDGDQQVTPIAAMREASTVVAQYQLTRLTSGRLSVEDVNAEAGIALTLFGIYGMSIFSYDDALSLSRSLNISLVNKTAGYVVDNQSLGINDERTAKTSRNEEFEGYFAPVVRKTNKLRLAMPEERAKKRLEEPQTEWDVMQGLIMAYREGEAPLAHAYLEKHAQGHEDKVIGVLKVWADGCGSEELKKEAQRILFNLK